MLCVAGSISTTNSEARTAVISVVCSAGEVYCEMAADDWQEVEAGSWRLESERLASESALAEDWGPVLPGVRLCPAAIKMLRQAEQAAESECRVPPNLAEPALASTTRCSCMLPLPHSPDAWDLARRHGQCPLELGGWRAVGRALWAWDLLEAAAALQGVGIMQLCSSGAEPLNSGPAAADGDHPALRDPDCGSVQQQSTAGAAAAAAAAPALPADASQAPTGECSAMPTQHEPAVTAFS